MATGISWQNPGGSSFNLQSTDSSGQEGIITSHIYDDSMPDVRLVDFPLSRRDGFKEVSSYWGNKLIKIDGLIKSVTASGVDGQIDQFKKNLYPQAQGNLTVSRGTGDRVYPAFVKSVTITRDSTDVTRAPFSAEFVCEQGFGQEPTYIAFTTFSGLTQSSFTFNVLTSGTAPYTPVMKFNTVAATQLGRLTITNQATGDTIEVDRAFSAGDLLTIDTSSSSVRVNSSGITYSGVMLRFISISGTNPIAVSTASGTQTYDFSVNYIPKYL